MKMENGMENPTLGQATVYKCKIISFEQTKIYSVVNKCICMLSHVIAIIHINVQ